MTRHLPRLVALHCGAKGVGFVVFEGQAIYDWGTIVVHGDKNAMALRKLTRLIDRFSPEVLVLEDANTAARRADRLVHLYNAIASLCQSRNIGVQLYPQWAIQHHFSQVGAVTRQEIAEAIARQLSVLAPRLPYPRKPWQSEARRMAIFSAAAVALTHLAQGNDFQAGAGLSP